MTTRAVAIGAAVLSIGLALGAQLQRGSRDALDGLFGKWRNAKRPGIAAVVVRDGRIEYQTTRGYSDLEQGLRIAPDTRFLVGSISKQFTAMAILMLASEGKLSLDDTAAKFIPETPQYARTVTLRQLLHHTGGLPDHEELLAGKIDTEFFSSARGARSGPFKISDAFAALRRPSSAPRFAPGEKWEYSNTGYLLLGQVIERVCGCSYANFLRRRIFEPLKMPNSGVISLSPASGAALAKAYAKRGSGGWTDVSYSPLNFMVGHDGVVSTLTDMVQWVRAMESGRGLPAGSLEAAFRSGGTNDGRPTGYGFGWRLNELGGRRVVEHEGCWSGYRNGIVHVPELELSAIVLTNAADGESFWNCDDGLALARELVRRSLGIR